MENEENLAVLKEELKMICEQLTKKMDQLDNKTAAEIHQAKLAC